MNVYVAVPQGFYIPYVFKSMGGATSYLSKIYMLHNHELVQVRDDLWHYKIDGQVFWHISRCFVEE